MVTKKFLSMLVLVFLSTALFTACGNNNNNVIIPPATPEAALLATGGTSTSGSGGAGGSVYLESYGGAVKVLKSGTVDAVIAVPTFTPNFGDPTTHAVVSAGTTTVLLDSDPTDGCLYAKNSDGDAYLYLGNGDGDATNDPAVTGLTVEAGATLVLVDQNYWGGYGELWLDNDLVVNGTIITDASSGIYIEANTIDVEASGKISTSATTTDSDASELYLGYDIDMTYQIINKGIIEAKGLGTGTGGYIYLDAHDLVVNTGTIDASGGDSTVEGSAGGAGGTSGTLIVYSDFGDFYSSGIVRVSGGKGATEGGANEADYCNYDCNSVLVETNYYGNAASNGDIFISGTWEANGGEGVDGLGGYGGYIWLQTDTLGAVTINADMSVKGGDSTGTASYAGGSTYGIDIHQSFDPWNMGGFTVPTTAGKIRIAGKYDLRGGSGDEMGGDAGYLEVYGNNYNQDVPGADIELVGFAAMDLNGGKGTSGGSASSWAFGIYTYNTASGPAGAITNEAKIDAKGGRATLAGNTGGQGGYVDMITYGTGDPAEVINNSGAIDISGGAGDTGGEAYGGGSWDALYLEAIHITNSGALTANGGNGTTAGGNGGNITLYSTDYTTTPTTNTGTLSAAGGTGTAAGTPGTITIDGGGPI